MSQSFHRKVLIRNKNQNTCKCNNHRSKKIYKIKPSHKGQLNICQQIIINKESSSQRTFKNPSLKLKLTINRHSRYRQYFRLGSYHSLYMFNNDLISIVRVMFEFNPILYGRNFRLVSIATIQDFSGVLLLDRKSNSRS